MSVEDSEYDDPEYLTGEVIDFIEYRNTIDDTFLHTAAIRNDIEAVKLLVQLGLDPNITGDMGSTALHDAAYRKYIDIYEYLVEHGADENIVNEFGKTPLGLIKSTD